MAYVKADRCGHTAARAVFMRNMSGKFRCNGYVCPVCKVIVITGGFKNHSYLKPLVFTLREERKSGNNGNGNNGNETRHGSN